MPVRAMFLERCRPVEERPLVSREQRVLQPGAGEVSLDMLACGVCRTDLHMVEGDLELPRLPTIPGHQVVGRVDGVGPGVDSELIGRIVGVAWMAGACGECPDCLGERENLCADATFTGMHRNGGFAEKVIARADFVYPLPRELPPVQAAPLLCAGVIGFRALRLAGALEGGALGIWGFGASAHLSLQVARHTGCSVFVVTRSPAHRRLARELGADWAGPPGAALPGLLDHAVVFSPAGEQIPEVLAALRPGGTAACAGITMSDVPGMPYRLLYGERVLRSVANATREDARHLLDLAVSIPLQPEIETMNLEQANDALDRVKHSRVNGALVLVP